MMAWINFPLFDLRDGVSMTSFKMIEMYDDKLRSYNLFLLFYLLFSLLTQSLFKRFDFGRAFLYAK